MSIDQESCNALVAEHDIYSRFMKSIGILHSLVVIIVSYRILQVVIYAPPNSNAKLIMRMSSCIHHSSFEHHYENH